MRLSTKIYNAIENGTGDILQLEQDVIQQNDARGAYLLAKYFQDVNVKALQDIVIKSKRPAFIYWFARFVPNITIKPLHQAIVKSGNLNYNYHFINFIKGTSTNAVANKDYNASVDIFP